MVFRWGPVYYVGITDFCGDNNLLFVPQYAPQMEAAGGETLAIASGNS
jgi:hypothetical protein